MTTRRDYYNTARDMARTRRGLEWLCAAMRDPSPQMTAHKIRVIRAAIRNIHPTTKL